MFRKLLKRAQGATEYLIILAVVIIIALIVVAAMGGIPGIGTGAKARASSSFWQTSDIAIPSSAISASLDILNVSLRNNMRDSISALTITVGGTALTCDATNLASGQTTKCGASKNCANSGDAFAYDVSIGYTDSATGRSYTYTGEGHQLEGKCAT